MIRLRLSNKKKMNGLLESIVNMKWLYLINMRSTWKNDLDQINPGPRIDPFREIKFPFFRVSARKRLTRNQPILPGNCEKKAVQREICSKISQRIAAKILASHDENLTYIDHIESELPAFCREKGNR